MKHNRLFLILAACATLAGMTACKDDEGGSAASPDSFFIQDELAYNLTSNPAVTIPVARLAQSGDLTVNVSTTGSSLFTVPSSVIIKDGDRIGELVVEYDPKSLTFNEVYELDITISGFNSIYGYGTAHVIIEYPTSYFEYGSGTITEGWWGEEEEKVMYAREYAENVFQCYLPECWGHDSGGPDHYPVQDYVFYWNYKTNKVYVPFQYMGCEDWCIADLGAIACKFGGPDYKEGSAEWMSYIDQYYTTSEYAQPHYDPDKQAFYLSDSAACSPATGKVVYGTPGAPDIFYLE